jgi:hypothetical protein
MVVTADVNSVPRYLHHVDLGSVTNVSEIRAASIFSFTETHTPYTL